MRYALFLALFVGAAALTAYAYLSNPSEKRRAEINNLMLGRQFQEALARTDEMIKRHPELIWPRLSKARILDLIGDLEGAEREYDLARERFPEAPEPVYEEARFFVRKNRVEDAKVRYAQLVSLYESAASGTKDHPKRDEHLGVAYFWLGEYEQSIAHLAQCVAEDPDNLVGGITLTKAKEELARQYTSH